MICLLLLYAAVAFILLVFSGVTAIDLWGYFRKDSAYDTRDGYAPKTLVIVPCRGKDVTLEKNLASLMKQGYKNYEAVAVVDDEKDAALSSIRKVGMKHIVSESRCTGCSGKVRAISSALERFPGYGAYVIADSDILVKSEWLSLLIEPLSDKKVGISTSFPLFNPVGGFWSKVKMVWGFVGDGLLEPEATRFGWGGSLAFRKELVAGEWLKKFSSSKYSLSDDISLTKIAKGRGYRIAYVRAAKPIVNSDDDFGTFSEWSTRQTAFTLLGYRKNLYYGVAFYSAEMLLFISGVTLSVLVSPLFIILLAHMAQSIARNYRRAGRKDLFIAPLTVAMPFIYTANLLKARSLKKITWRGREYSMF